MVSHRLCARQQQFVIDINRVGEKALLIENTSPSGSATPVHLDRVFSFTVVPKKMLRKGWRAESEFNMGIPRERHPWLPRPVQRPTKDGIADAEEWYR